MQTDPLVKFTPSCEKNAPEFKENTIVLMKKMTCQIVSDNKRGRGRNKGESRDRGDFLSRRLSGPGMLLGELLSAFDILSFTGAGSFIAPFAAHGSRTVGRRPFVAARIAAYALINRRIAARAAPPARGPA
ncbi:hypothetical protein EVAR_70777_1 [Eumeta japonica]|uniref:Uncharacterized protein n=1 Tax=Eumeta variegata TaxID=151549 RepID=A0A4C1SD57_EUMVA|nr:hypothetical protein EVAR_70777_1 [Eumeta japonica]